MQTFAKVGLDALLTPENCVVLLIDHQPFQLASEMSLDKSLAGRGRSACKEAILEMAGQKRVVLQVSDRLSLGVENGLYALDNIFAIRQKQSQQLDVGLKRHLTKRLLRHDVPPR